MLRFGYYSETNVPEFYLFILNYLVFSIYHSGTIVPDNNVIFNIMGMLMNFYSELNVPELFKKNGANV